MRRHVRRARGHPARAILILLLLATALPAGAQSGSDDTPLPLSFSFAAGRGNAYPDLNRGLDLSGTLYLGAGRALTVRATTMAAAIVDALPIWGKVGLTLAEVGALYSASIRGPGTRASAGIGLAVIWRSGPGHPDPSWEVFNGYGVPLEVRIDFLPAFPIGLAVGGTANLNVWATYGAVWFGVRMGIAGRAERGGR